MVNWDEIKSKLTDVGDKTKQLFSQAADKTQKGAKVASLKVKIVMEENKISKAMCELGKKVYELAEKDEANILGSSQVKEIVRIIKASKKTIDSVNEEISSI
jgi:hypothetical protein